MKKYTKLSAIILFALLASVVFQSCSKNFSVDETTLNERVDPNTQALVPVSTTSKIERQAIETTLLEKNTDMKSESVFDRLVKVNYDNREQLLKYDDDIIFYADTDDGNFEAYCDVVFDESYRLFDVGDYWYILPDVVKIDTLGDFEYALHKNGCIQIIRYSGTDTDIVIPERISDYPVTYIGKDSFSKRNITSVKIGDNVKVIGNDAFSECNSLEKVELSNNIRIISTNSFSCCDKLKDFSLPKKLQMIGHDAFMFCDINEVDIPKSVEYIGCGALSECDNLKTVQFNGGTIYIDNGLIYNSAVENIYLPKDVKITSRGGTFSCETLRKVEYAPMMDEDTEIFADMYMDCQNLTNVKLSDNITKIGEYAFQNCRSLKEIHIPASVKRIDTWAFSQCYSLKDIYFDSPDCDGLDDSGIPGQIRVIHAPSGGNIEKFCGRHLLVKFVAVENS